MPLGAAGPFKKVSLLRPLHRLLVQPDLRPAMVNEIDARCSAGRPMRCKCSIRACCVQLLAVAQLVLRLQLLLLSVAAGHCKTREPP
jgi:hypothetical protein